MRNAILEAFVSEGPRSGITRFISYSSQRVRDGFAAWGHSSESSRVSAQSHTAPIFGRQYYLGLTNLSPLDRMPAVRYRNAVICCLITDTRPLYVSTLQEAPQTSSGREVYGA
jgi:hypothetical protein